MPIFVRLFRQLARRCKALGWTLFMLLLFGHAATSALWFWLAGEDVLLQPTAFAYYYMVTATTVGYGDLSPATDAGRLITAFWVIPGGVALFAALLGKTSALLFDFWRRGLLGKLDMAKLSGHTILIGWHGDATERMVDLLLADTRTDDEGIVLCVTGPLENPLPEKVRFVRGESYFGSNLLERAGLASASRVLIYGTVDAENLAVALAVLGSGTDAHVVTHFDDSSMAALLRKQFPQAECTSTLAVEMLVRAAQDPGISVVTNELLSVQIGPTQYSLALPNGFPEVRFGKLFAQLKERLNATALGYAEDHHGLGLHLNPPPDDVLRSGHVLFYLAPTRLDSEAVRGCV